jgi:uncharacterized protein (TIGR02266 family)
MQDTRKDPRAKVLTMTVRYKSATLDEFIEHHSYDISRGGMFIKTPSPFPPGTLLKFEVKIAEEQKLMQGVGRVVWKRESSEIGEDRPAGMGVKFIKIDEPAKQLIDQLVARRGEERSAFEAGQAPSGPPAAPIAAAAAPLVPFQPTMERKATPKPGPVRKATMLGLGLDQSSSEPAGGGGFFPKTDSEAEMPAPEDRTVMKQAAELLQDALREAGASMDEVGESEAAKPKATPAVPRPAAGVPAEMPSEPTIPDELAWEKSEPEAAEAKVEPTAEEAAAEALEKGAELPREPVGEEAEVGEAPEKEVEPAAAAELRALHDADVKKELVREEEVKPPSIGKAKVESEIFPAGKAARAAPLAEPPSSGGGWAIALLLGVAAVALLFFFITRKPAEQLEPVPATPTAPPSPAKEEPPPGVEPPPEPVVDAAAAVPDAAVDAGKPKAEEKPAVVPPKLKPRKPKPKPELDAGAAEPTEGATETTPPKTETTPPATENKPPPSPEGQ